jgi:alpha-glucosidase
MRPAAPLATAGLFLALLTPAHVAQADSDIAATAAAKKSRTSVTLKVGATKTIVADAVAAKVAVTPAGKRTVRIQTRSKTNTWETVKKAKTNASGVLKTSFTTYKSGDYKVRALVDETAKRAGATSGSKALKATYPSFGDPPKEELDPIKPGSLKVKKTATATTGEFRIRVRKSGVTVTDGAGRTAWESTPDKAFLAATRSTLRWFQRSTAGAFWAQVDRGAELVDQTISSVTTSGDTVRIKGTVKGDGKKGSYTLTMEAVQRTPDVAVLQLGVTFNDKKSDVKVNSIQLTSGRGSDKAVHGFGNQYQGFDLSGQVLPILVQEQGVTRGQMPAAGAVDQATWGAGNLKTTYGGWPTYVTEENRSFALTDSRASGAFSIADMRRAKQISLESFADTMYADVVARDTPKDLLAARGAGVSRPALSDSVQRGAVLGLQGGTDKVRQVVADMQAAGTKVDAVWLQDWVGKRVTSFGQQLWWTWQLNNAWYPGWDQMVADFKAQDIDVLTYVNPFVINQDEVDGVPIRNLYKEAEQKGFLVENQVGDTYVVETIGFPTALVDLTDPAARDWFAGVIAEQVIGVGATGFMADFAEYTPFDSVLEKGKAAKQHNRWPQLWADTVKEACKRGGVPDCVAFFRSSYLGSPKSVPLMWAGDQMVNYAIEDGMANAVQGMLSGGVSGAPLWHSDIGGYTSVNAAVTNFIRPPDLNARWAEMQAFGVVMRTHETNRPTMNQQVYDTPTTRAQFARASQIYAALYDYRKTVIDESVATGIPAMRHGWLVHPGTKAAEKDLQFFLGDHLLMAPVLKENATTVSVTFPPGTWKHVLTGAEYTGDTTVTVPAPIGTPAAFVKVGDPVGEQTVAALQAAGLTG